jgi:LPXTG-motif cell wall-anchored protein
VTEIDVIVDDPIESYSLLVTWTATLAATGFEAGTIIPIAVLLLLLGSVGVVAVRVRRSRAA